MYIYYNKEGKATTRIDHGEVPRQGGTVNIRVLLDRDWMINHGFAAPNYSLSMQLKAPNNVLSAAKIDGNGNANFIFRKLYSSEIIYDIVPETPYLCYSGFSFFGPDTKTVGTTEVVLSVIKTEVVGGVLTNTVVFSFGSVSFNMERTYGDAKQIIDEISQPTYEELVARITDLDSRKLNKPVNYESGYEIKLNDTELGVNASMYEYLSSRFGIKDVGRSAFYTIDDGPEFDRVKGFLEGAKLHYTTSNKLFVMLVNTNEDGTSYEFLAVFYGEKNYPEFFRVNLNGVKSCRLDYNELDNAAIINQDLDDPGFEPVNDTFYRHTEGASPSFDKGKIYYYDNGEYYQVITSYELNSIYLELNQKASKTELDNAISAERSARQAADEEIRGDIDTISDEITQLRSDVLEKIEQAEGSISVIESKIPNEATATNKLADRAWVQENAGGKVMDVLVNGASIVENKIANIVYETGLGADSNNTATVTAIRAFVNSSIEAVAAYYITSNAQGDSFPTKASLTNATKYYYAGSEKAPTKNDYALVQADESHENKTSRYMYVVPDSATTGSWEFQYTFNMQFTQSQIDTLNSGITAAKVALYDAHIASTSNPHSVTKAQIGLGSVVNTGDTSVPTQNSTEKFTSGGAYTELAKKVSKVTTATDHTQAYIKNTDGSQSMMDVCVTFTGGTIAQRGSTGTLAVADPLTETHAVNKRTMEEYVAEHGGADRQPQIIFNFLEANE